ncbi:Ca-activated chloride channel family protein [Saccharothrix tamanrassetensis]|uniref:Ca-activated chloride channel family protein n=1 Tax=Saccharothrix tamanrassetensis TaxID=1051531 RepID=A0A841CCQ6_9PSEU|nr:VIT domain-containing protein [Saccharothrix tamanrassetensis]MBB5953795.1 Ca-activated chloride channel family protein [Saccharothrix tamanrassetensis]
MSTPIEVIDAVARPAAAADDGLGCLRTERGNLPLEAVDVRASITGLASQTTITQTFHNPHDQPLEATYIFPLPSRSAVTALRMEADDRVVEGVLKERGEARADYDQAIATGKRAAIAEEERPGVFTTRVGNVMPGERITVRLTLAGTLAYEDDAATFRLPLVVAPRYIPGTPLEGGQVGDGVAVDTDAVPDASRISPPVLLPGFPNPVRLSLEVDVDTAGLPPATPSASLHATVTEQTASGFRVKVRPGSRVDRDFLLRLEFADDDAVRTSLAVRPDEGGTAGTFALTVLPPRSDAATRGRDVVLVLDRSGSMDGWKMVAARRAAGRIVDSLTTGDRFAVLAFDNVVDTPGGLPAGLVDATDRNRYRAVEFLAGLDARGGTEMPAPLHQAADLLGVAGERERVLVLVTDGQVGDEDRLLRELATPLSGVRVHTVGIDRAVNEAFLHRLAGTTGRFELVESEDRLDEAMRGIHRRIGAPVLTGLTVRSAGLGLDAGSLAPWPLPDLFHGAPVVVTGRYTGEAGGVELSGDHGWRQQLTAVASDNPSLAALWARARVRDLEDRYVVGRGDLAELERRIVATSLEFGVLSRFTAFVAVDSRVVNESGQVHRVTQPVESPDGWAPTGGVFGGGGYGAPPPPVAMSAPAHFAPPAGAPAAGRPAPAPRRMSVSAEAPAVAKRADTAPAPHESDVPAFLEPTPAQPPRSPSPMPVPPQPVRPAPAEPLARFVVRELEVLRRADATDADRALAHLAAEINRLHPAWTTAGEPVEHVRTLRELAETLATPTTEPARRLQQAITTLEGLTAPRRARFWKR